MTSNEEIESLQENKNFTETMLYFRLNSLLYFAFEVTNNTDTINASSDDKLKDVLIYEAYLAGNHTVFNHIPNGSIYLNCKFCEGMSLRRFNFHHRTLKVTAVVCILQISRHIFLYRIYTFFYSFGLARTTPKSTMTYKFIKIQTGL